MMLRGREKKGSERKRKKRSVHSPTSFVDRMHLHAEHVFFSLLITVSVATSLAQSDSGGRDLFPSDGSTFDMRLPKIHQESDSLSRGRMSWHDMAGNWPKADPRLLNF